MEKAFHLFETIFNCKLITFESFVCELVKIGWKDQYFWTTVELCGIDKQELDPDGLGQFSEIC